MVDRQYFHFTTASQPMTTRRLITHLLMFAFTLSASAAPLELDTLRQQYDKLHTERVFTPHEKTLAELDAKFSTALENAITSAKSSGDLPTVLALQADQKLLAAKQPLPSADAADTPESLTSLRAIYREQLAKLTAQRGENNAALLAPYAAKLQELEATLTKGDRVEDAAMVMAYRLTLKSDSPVPPAAPVPPTPVVPGTTPTAPVSPARIAEGNDLKAAEWLIGLGGAVKLSSSGGNYLAKLADLPPDRFQITALRFPSPMPPGPNEAFDALSGLFSLEQIYAAGGGPQTDEAFRFLATCPALRYIDVQNWSTMEGRWLDYVTGLEHLEKLWVTSSAEGNLGGLARLSSKKLIWLHLRSTGTTDETLAVVGGLKTLETLHLRGNPISDAGLAALAGLTRLETLDVMETSVSAEAVSTLVGLPLSDLGFGLSQVDLMAAVPNLAKAFPKLTGLNLPKGQWTKADLASLGAYWPRIQRIEFATGSRFDEDTFDGMHEAMPDFERAHFKGSPFADGHVKGLAALRKLKLMDLTDTKVTDSALPTLQSIRSLKYLDLGRTQVSPTALAEFKKQRPDVEIKP